MVMLHGCTIGDETLIGMARPSNNAKDREKECIIGAHTLIPRARRSPTISLVMGSPGKSGEDAVGAAGSRLPEKCRAALCRELEEAPRQRENASD